MIMETCPWMPTSEWRGSVTLTCSRCKAVKYCSKGHQKLHCKKVHKKVCRPLKTENESKYKSKTESKTEPKTEPPKKMKKKKNPPVQPENIYASQLRNVAIVFLQALRNAAIVIFSIAVGYKYLLLKCRVVDQGGEVVEEVKEIVEASLNDKI